jgi:lipoate-protein ligase A
MRAAAASDMNASPDRQAEVEPPGIVHQCLCAAQEQDWNACGLSDTVSEPRIRLWTYRSASVVLGSAQRAMVDGQHAARKFGMEFVVRAAGGGAVLVGPWMLSASILLPGEHPLVRGGPVESYRWLGQAYADVLGEFGLAARAMAPQEAREEQKQPDRQALSWSCYGGLSPWEVVIGQRKIVGLAQVRKRTGVLLVAGLLVARPDWKLLCRAMERPEQNADSLARLTTSCIEELESAPRQPDLVNRLSDSLHQAVRA